MRRFHVEQVELSEPRLMTVYADTFTISLGDGDHPTTHGFFWASVTGTNGVSTNQQVAYVRNPLSIEDVTVKDDTDDVRQEIAEIFRAAERQAKDESDTPSQYTYYLTYKDAIEMVTGSTGRTA